MELFGIDWEAVQWSNLSKSLFSALAARLALFIGVESIPSAGNINAQAEQSLQH